MSDNNNNNRFGREDDEREQSFNESRKSENSGSYYYSYGPFQSMNTDKENHAPEANDVEVTPPEPVKPIPTMVERSSSNFTRSGAPSTVLIAKHKLPAEAAEISGTGIIITSPKRDQISRQAYFPLLQVCSLLRS